MNKDWLQFEKIVFNVYRILYQNQNAIVKHNDYFIGKNSGRKRQIDVSIKFDLPGNHELKIVVSCKNYKKKPNIALIDEFAGLIDDVGANKGILICKSGFGKSILEYSKNIGIDLCSLDDLEKLDLLEDLKIPISFYKFDYDLLLNAVLYENQILPDKINLEINEKYFSFDKNLKFSIADYILQFWRNGKLDENHNSFSKEIKIENIYYKYYDLWIMFTNFKIVIVKTLDIKYQLFKPKEYYNLRHFTKKDEIKLASLDVELCDFNHKNWSSEKPDEFEKNRHFGNYLFITVDQYLNKEILERFSLPEIKIRN